MNKYIIKVSIYSY